MTGTAGPGVRADADAAGMTMGEMGVTGRGISGMLSVVGLGMLSVVGPGMSDSLHPAFAMAKHIRSEVKSSPSVSEITTLEVKDDCQT